MIKNRPHKQTQNNRSDRSTESKLKSQNEAKCSSRTTNYPKVKKQNKKQLSGAFDPQKGSNQQLHQKIENKLDFQNDNLTEIKNQSQTKAGQSNRNTANIGLYEKKRMQYIAIKNKEMFQKLKHRFIDQAQSNVCQPKLIKSKFSQPKSPKRLLFR